MKLGLQYAEGVICGSNARCVALLGALKQVRLLSPHVAFSKISGVFSTISRYVLVWQKNVLDVEVY